jgi:hypothetical protein
MGGKRFISGIYNTCDYWCARCAFTRRCRNFSMGQEMERESRGEAVDNDATNADFWNRLADKVRETAIFGPAEEWADDATWDMDDTPDPEWEARHDALQRAVKRHPLVLMAHDYMNRVGAWLKTADGDLKTVAQGLIEAAGSKFAEGDFEEQAREIGEMIEVVAWYHTLIPPKLARAINGLLEKDDAKHAILAEVRLEDANGSGKVVLIAIERSIAAWVRLREILPNREDEILAMLALLSRLQRGIHAALPGAKAFLRIGFDKEDDRPDDEPDASLPFGQRDER